MVVIIKRGEKMKTILMMLVLVFLSGCASVSKESVQVRLTPYAVSHRVAYDVPMLVYCFDGGKDAFFERFEPVWADAMDKHAGNLPQKMSKSDIEQLIYDVSDTAIDDYLKKYHNKIDTTGLSGEKLNSCNGLLRDAISIAGNRVLRKVK